MIFLVIAENALRQMILFAACHLAWVMSLFRSGDAPIALTKPYNRELFSHHWIYLFMDVFRKVFAQGKELAHELRNEQKPKHGMWMRYDPTSIYEMRLW